MKKSEKNQFIDDLAEQLKEAGSFYLTDTSALNAEATSRLRRTCFKRNVQLKVVKNTLLKKALEKSGKSFDEFFPILKGDTSIMFAEIANDPAKLIKEFRRTSPKPILKGAFIEESIYLGDDQLDALVNVKSRLELIGDLIGLLQSPAKNVISALQSGSRNLSGIVKTLSEKPE
ncbi:MAG: 50S ribosomal protein L10 [Bacteroidales bacterium]|jgi:large subunit ribosomal protein L10|nr:50S ribosomal protein L10 [Bacteroidales bacterium]